MKSYKQLFSPIELFDLFVFQTLTTGEIANKLNSSAPTIVKWLKIYNIYQLRPNARPKHSNETKLKMKQSHEGQIFTTAHKAKLSLSKRSEQNPNWRGGLTKLKYNLRKVAAYKNWRTSVFQRDKYRCVFCNHNGRLEADHIKPFSTLLIENYIVDLDSALQCQNLWDINNGRTLCKSCHSQTESYLNARLNKN